VDYWITSVKSSSLPGILACLTLAAAMLAAPQARAQDTVTQKSGPVREGRITGVSGGNVRLQVGGSTIGIPLADVAKIDMPAPPEFDAAAAQLASGDAKGALAALQKLNDTYAGLPAPWAERAAAMLGDAKLAAGDTAGAKAAYENFSKTYPQATVLASLGMARLAVDAGKNDEAEKLLTPVLANSAKTAFPAPAEGSSLSQAHYLMGRIREAGGDLQAALEHYLTAAAVFPFDKNASASAQARADSLRKANTGLIAP
jgi:TolA-binding protein